MLQLLIKSACINGRGVFTARLSSKVNLVATAANRGNVAVRGYADKPTTPVGKEAAKSAASMGTSTASRSPATATASTSPSSASARLSDNKSFNLTSANRQIAVGGAIVIAALIAYMNWPSGKPKDV